MDIIDLVEAERRFGPLLEPRTRTYRMFGDSKGGAWRPHFEAGRGVIGYRLYPEPRSPVSPHTKRKARKVTIIG